MLSEDVLTEGGPPLYPHSQLRSFGLTGCVLIGCVLMGCDDRVC